MSSSDTLPPPCQVCGSLVRRGDGACASCGTHWAPAPPQANTSDIEPTDPFIGEIVAEKFEVHSLLGVGGAGRVYRAEQLGLDRPVALKLLHPHLALQQEQRQRFHREARAASRISHPGAVTVYDFGLWKDHLYIALELVEGRSLAALLDAEYPLGHKRVVHLLAQVADVLVEAHRLGVLHRDLKPENVMVTHGLHGNEMVKVVDFGLAILYGPQTEARLTQDGVISGTPAYMSPEQIRGEELDHHSDLYSLGVMLYEMLCGEVPFSSKNVTEVLVGHLFHPPPPPSDVETESEVHPLLEALALRTLSKSRFERPDTAQELRQELLRALDQPRERVTRTSSQTGGLDRLGRADAAGIMPPPAATKLERPAPQQARPLVVLEQSPRATSSLCTLMLANGFPVESATSLDEALVAARSVDAEAVIVDLCQDPTARLQSLAGRLSGGRLAGVDVVVVGPEDDMSLMKWALNMGLSRYVPRSAVVERLPKVVGRLLRRLHRRR